MACQKCSRPTGSKDKNHQKRKGAKNQIDIIEKENENRDIIDHKILKEV